jgi:pyruvate/2-oxoglutarate/acetoin dehydrogenase E1 component
MKYYAAIQDATAHMMRHDERVFICGLGVPDPKGVFGSTLGLLEEFGPTRVFDTPACENATVGMLLGAAQQGLRPIMVNQRVDFTLLALDQLINHAAKWKKMFGGAQSIPLVIRMIVGKGWGQGPQHSQSLHGLFAYIPGLKVIAPATPKDMKGLLISAIEDDNPVVVIEHRRLYDQDGDAPEDLYRVPLGQANIVRSGQDVTVVAISQMVVEAQKAAEALAEKQISAEVLDLRTLRPLDMETVWTSVKKTGRLVVADGDWPECGVASEIIAQICERDISVLKANPKKITWPAIPSPTSEALEPHFYPGAQDIINACITMLDAAADTVVIEQEKQVFQGPF